MQKPTKVHLNQYLKEMSKIDLEKEVKKLYSKFKQVKEFYEMEFCQDTTIVVDKYKAIIKQEYFPSRGVGRANNKESKKVITQFKKVAIFQKDIADLTIYRCEIMCDFINEDGFIDESFVKATFTAFKDSCKIIMKEKLFPIYKVQLQGILDKTYDSSYSLYNDLLYLYKDYFQSEI